MSGHISQQAVTRFLQAALEASIYVAPTNPGLTYEELAEAGRVAGFLPGEINDAIPYVTTQTFGGRGRSKHLPPNPSLLPLLMIFIPSQEPDFRNPEAFEFVFEQLRLSVRMHGARNAKIERGLLIGTAAEQQFSQLDVEVAIAIMAMNELLIEEEGFIRFAPGKESYGSPAQQLSNPVRVPPIRKDALARAYPIVESVIQLRTQPPVLKPEAIQTEQGHGSKPPPLSISSDEDWISSASAIAILGRHHTRTICKRAHAGLIKARAERYIRDGHSADNIDVPTEFWWANGEAALTQNWTSGDFETWIDHRLHLQAFGVMFRRSDIERAKPAAASFLEQKHGMTTEKHIFIGHGRSHIWFALKDFLEMRLGLTVDEFNRVPTAGVAIANRLDEMLDGAAFAFLILTAEDEQADGTLHARLNVVHEAGLFQGRLGLKRAIIMLEEGCEEFSNIHGLGQLRFPAGKIDALFEEIRKVLERENIMPGRA